MLLSCVIQETDIVCVVCVNVCVGFCFLGWPLLL